MTKLVIALATRARPLLLLETLSRTLPNIVRSNTMLIVMVDSDDHATIKALECSDLKCAAGRLVINIREREDTVADKFNRALNEPADLYLAMVDHSPHLTPGFDQMILDAAALFPDGIGVVYNHLANASFPSVNAVTRKLIDMMGYLYPPYFPYWFVDHWLDDVARIIDRISFADVIVDSSKKQNTQEMREPSWWATFFDAAYRMRRRQAHSIINANDFQEAPWRKDMLRNHHPLIEFRSRWVNESVRFNTRALQSIDNLSLQDARYQRARAAAAAMVPSLLDDYGMPMNEVNHYRSILLPPTNVTNIKRAFA